MIKANKEASQKRIQYLISLCDSQQEFADKIKMNKASVSQYVNGTCSPSNLTSKRIAEVFNVNPAWVMGFDVPMENDKIKVASYTMPEAAKLIDDYNLLNDLGKAYIREQLDNALQLPKYTDQEKGDNEKMA